MLAVSLLVQAVLFMKPAVSHTNQPPEAPTYAKVSETSSECQTSQLTYNKTQYAGGEARQFWGYGHWG
jgi:hypothetical protein